MKENNKGYKSCKDVSEKDCYTGGKHCTTCMYRDNERYSDGTVKSSVVSGVHDWCSAKRREISC